MSNYVSVQKLNRRVTIQRNAFSQDSWGQMVPGWVDVARVWAHVKFARGAEVFRGGTEVSNAVASVRIRWRVGVEAGMRVKMSDNEIYNIHAVLPDEQDHRHLDLVVGVGPTQG